MIVALLFICVEVTCVVSLTMESWALFPGDRDLTDRQPMGDLLPSRWKVHDWRVGGCH